MKLVDVHELLLNIPEFDLPGDTVDAISLRMIIASMKEAVVQCKDCEWWNRIECPMHHEEFTEDDIIREDWTLSNGTGYCNFGVRKKDHENEQ